MAPKTAPDYTALIDKATAGLVAAIEANSPCNACRWLELLDRLTKATSK
jgi:hypothetical protein